MKDLQEIYRELAIGKDSKFWKALELYLDQEIKVARAADDDGSLDTWTKIGINIGTKCLANKIKNLVNKDSIMYLDATGGDKGGKTRR